MSFETWIRKHYGPDPDLMYQTRVRKAKAAWDAGRAESEAELVELEDRHTELGMRFIALQAERDALREALEEISQYWNGLENPKATHDACEHNLRVAASALSTPASGEPARKP